MKANLTEDTVCRQVFGLFCFYALNMPFADLAIHIRAWRQVRDSLPFDVANTIASVIVWSGMDYYNSLLCNISENIQKLKEAQKYLARVVMTVSWLTYNLLVSLHWLPVAYWIDCKLAIVILKAGNQLICPSTFIVMFQSGKLALQSQCMHRDINPHEDGFTCFQLRNTNNLESSTESSQVKAFYKQFVLNLD